MQPILIIFLLAHITISVIAYPHIILDGLSLVFSFRSLPYLLLVILIDHPYNCLCMRIAFIYCWQNKPDTGLVFYHVLYTEYILKILSHDLNKSFLRMLELLIA